MLSDNEVKAVADKIPDYFHQYRVKMNLTAIRGIALAYVEEDGQRKEVINIYTEGPVPELESIDSLAFEIVSENGRLPVQLVNLRSIRSIVYKFVAAVVSSVRRFLGRIFRSVVHTTRLGKFLYRKYTPPFQGGDLIAGTDWGTLGGLVISPSEDRYVITCAHTVAGGGILDSNCGRTIAMARRVLAVPRPERVEIATVTHHTDFSRSPLKSDAALAHVLQKGLVDTAVKSIGTPAGHRMARAGDSIQFYGASSKRLRTDTLESVAGTWTIGECRYTFTHLMRMRGGAAPGDSGSLVFAGKEVVGLLFYIDAYGYVYANDIDAVFTDLGVPDWLWKNPSAIPALQRSQ